MSNSNNRIFSIFNNGYCQIKCSLASECKYSTWNLKEVRDIYLGMKFSSERLRTHHRVKHHCTKKWARRYHRGEERKQVIKAKHSMKWSSIGFDNLRLKNLVWLVTSELRGSLVSLKVTYNSAQLKLVASDLALQIYQK